MQKTESTIDDMKSMSLEEILNMLDSGENVIAAQNTTGLGGGTSETFSGTATTTGDPHVVGFNGEEYDFMGDDNVVYNMISTGTTQVNVRMSEIIPERTYMSEIGIKVPNYKFRIWLDEKSEIQCELNEKPINRNSQQETVYFLSGLKNKDGSDNMGVAVFNLEDKWVTIDTGNCKFYIYKETEMYDNTVSCPHLNISTIVQEIGILSDGVKPHGFMGVTANHNTTRDCIGANGEGIIEGEYTDYEVSGIFADDFKFNSFGTKANFKKIFGYKSGSKTFVIE